MRPSVIKDRILTALVNKECGLSDVAIAKHLNIPTFTAYTLLKEIESDKLIETIGTTSISTGNSASCNVRRIYPQAYNFHKTTSYRRKAFWKDLEQIPKKYWFIGVLITSLGFNIKDAIQYFLRDKSHQPKTELVQQSIISDSQIIYSISLAG